MTDHKNAGGVEPAAQNAGGASPSQSPLMTKSEIFEGAKLATDKEQRMTLLQGIKLYPKAVAWSVLISTCIVMEGYDICLVNNFYAFPQWNEKYGVRYGDKYQVPAKWQAALSNGAVVGEIIGLFINGWASERFGYRYTILTCLLFLSGFITIFFTAQNVEALLAAEILCGIPWGVFQTLCITYATEVCPVALRNYLTTYVNFCWGLGQFIGIGVLKAMLNRPGEWSYRIPYALQWMWPVPLALAIFMAPESPWWLVRKGKTEEAKRSLLRLTSLNRETDFDADETIAMIVHTTALEQKITSGASYLDCFRGIDLRRTEIVCMVWAIQNLSGNSFSNYSTYFLEQAGVSIEHSYSFAMGQYGINMVGVFGAWFLMSRGIGRRTLYIFGLCGLCIMLLVMGFLGLVPESKRNSSSLATGSMMLIWALVYQLTVGTVCYSLVGELSSRRLQIKTVVLGRILYNIAAIVCNVLTPYMLNPSAWNWSNYAGFFWGGVCFCCIIYTYFRVPEPRGRSFAELDILFERGVCARRFPETVVDVFEEEVQAEVLAGYRRPSVSHSIEPQDYEKQTHHAQTAL
ncbi:MFS transporter, SP family, general alpha glucoside:H+ symporter [Blastomyces silverae]|uniref:MFS transporter, SP family, general alpha glucoside:H+ symporter n=1 Tax=Blastomyces silverae TaxID=2060906 RepID=A0A0H1BQD8_9EURO|nr:MFS transporter, SP family, general alpha glucoside:H+ symporter [Blastomyces silverae]